MGIRLRRGYGGQALTSTPLLRYVFRVVAGGLDYFEQAPVVPIAVVESAVASELEQVRVFPVDAVHAASAGGPVHEDVEVVPGVAGFDLVKIEVE